MPRNRRPAVERSAARRPPTGVKLKGLPTRGSTRRRWAVVAVVCGWLFGVGTIVRGTEILAEDHGMAPSTARFVAFGIACAIAAVTGARWAVFRRRSARLQAGRVARRTWNPFGGGPAGGLEMMAFMPFASAEFRPLAWCLDHCTRGKTVVIGDFWAGTLAEAVAVTVFAGAYLLVMTASWLATRGSPAAAPDLADGEFPASLA